MSAKSVTQISLQTHRRPAVKTAVSGEIVTILAPGESHLPKRRAGYAQSREAQLAELLEDLTGDGASLVEINFKKALEARASASVKALAVDLDCYSRFSARYGGIGLPAGEARVVAYVEDCEGRGLKPATVARRLSSRGHRNHCTVKHDKKEHFRKMATARIEPLATLDLSRLNVRSRQLSRHSNADVGGPNADIMFVLRSQN